MRSYDFSPLFRHTVGFDRMARLMDAALQGGGENAAYPPCNIEQQGENAYRITMAVAGFSEADLDVTQQENTLTLAGKGADAEDAVYLHRGIAGRAFERRFHLAEHVRVESAALADGLLSIGLVREVPEEKQPRRITVNSAPGSAPGSASAIEKKAA